MADATGDGLRSPDKADPPEPTVRQESHFGYLQCTPDGRILGASPHLARMLGHEDVRAFLEEMPSITDLYADEADRRRVAGRLRESVPADEARWTRADGTSMWIRTRLWPVTHADYAGVAFEIQVEDVTERRHLEEQLRQAQKMESVGQLAGGIAHDFNNILTVILSQLDFAAQSLGENKRETALTDIRDAREAALRGSHMVQHLLAFSRRDHLRIAPVCLAEIVANGARLIERLLPESIHIATEGDAEMKVLADPSAVEQILLNLATNARDAMATGGTLTLRCSRGQITAAEIQERGWGREETFGTLTVEDSGTGMTPDVVARVFEPFFTTKAAGRGTGLGLPMVYGLMKQHRGFVTVESTPGQGTAVRLWFPLEPGKRHAKGRRPTVGATDWHDDDTRPAADDSAEAPDAAASFPATGRGPGSAHRPQILVVDDDEVLRRVTSRALKTRGYRVLEASDGVEAWEYVESFGEPDLIVSDLMMPGMTGPELLKRLRSRNPSAPFLMTSGHGSGSMAREEGMPEGVPFLAKPWTVSELLNAVARLLPKS